MRTEATGTTEAPCGSFSLRWIAVFSKPREERRAAAALAEQGYPVYLPTTPDDRPLFPRYLFAECAATVAAAPIRSTRGVSAILMDGGGRPLHVDAETIGRVRDIEREAMTEEMAPKGPRPGQRVRISEGPLTGASGLLQMAGERRVIVLLDMLGRQSRAQIGASMIEPI